jgi:hypothetical protein
LNPKAIDGRTKPSELYTADHNNNLSNEDNARNYDGAMNVTEGWDENGTIIKLINIATTTNELATIRVDVDGHEQLRK